MTWMITDSDSITRMMAKNNKKERGVREHRNDGDRNAERHRTGIAHEELCGIDVVPQEREQSADHETAERGEVGTDEARRRPS